MMRFDQRTASVPWSPRVTNIQSPGSEGDAASATRVPQAESKAGSAAATLCEAPRDEVELSPSPSPSPSRPLTPTLTLALALALALSLARAMTSFTVAGGVYGRRRSAGARC